MNHPESYHHTILNRAIRSQEVVWITDPDEDHGDVEGYSEGRAPAQNPPDLREINRPRYPWCNQRLVSL